MVKAESKVICFRNGEEIMIAEFYFDVLNVAQIWGASQHQLSLCGIYWKSIGSEPNI